MKQLLFLLLFPCLAMAQYQGNAGQKITLGEQTTADGLVFRGVENDTALITPFSDTSAYIILDTINNKFYNYNRSTNVWSLAGGGGGGGGTGTVTSITAGTGLTGGTITTSGTLAADINFLVTRFDTASMLNNYYRSGRALGTPSSGTLTNATGLPLTTGITGVLPVANGGTGLTSLGTGVATFLGTPTSANLASAVTNETGSGSLVFATSPTLQTATITGGDGNQLFITNGGQDFTQLNFGQNSSVKSFFAIDHRSGFQGFVLGNQGSQPLYRKVSFRTNGAINDMILTNSEVWIGYTTDQGAYALQINGTPQAVNALVTTSDEKFKENITPLNKGLEIVNKLKPVTFNFISDTKNNFSVNEEVGFIAQDVDRALSTETFAKSIVNSADDSEPTSTMGLATQNLIPILVKAIQEQQALIKALEQRILILENK